MRTVSRRKAIADATYLTNSLVGSIERRPGAGKARRIAAAWKGLERRIAHIKAGYVGPATKMVG
jgi:hypothetical protein